MSKEEKRVPELRFKGFHDDWEQRELSEVSKVNPKSNLPDTFTYVDLESVKNNSLVSTVNMDKENAPSRAQRLASKGHIFFQTVRPYQRNNILYDLEGTDYVFSTGYGQIRPKISSEFLLNRMEGDGFVNKVLSRCTGTSYPAINSKDLSSISFYLPINEKEQSRIGKLLKYIDNCINLHRRRTTTLSNLKQEYFYKIFPFYGTDTTKIGFRKFNEKWEEVKFSNILESHPSKPFIMTPIKNGKYKIIQQGDTPVLGYADGEPFENFKNITLFGDHTVSLYRPKEPFFVATDGLKILSSKSVNSDFLYLILEKYKPESKGYKRHFSILKNSNLSLTPNYEEQEQLGKFFKLIDKISDLYQNKFEKLKKIKQSYLEKMFI